MPGPWSKNALMMVDPPRETGRPKGRHSRDNAPTEGEFQRLLDVCLDERDRLILMVLGNSGLRSKEFLTMRQEWLRDGKVFIPSADPKTGFTCKTRAASRAIPLRDMSEETWEVLTDWFEEHDRAGFCHGTMWLRVKNAGRRAHLGKHLFPHALRALFATRWAYRLGNPFLLMDLMGWSTPGIAIAYVRSVGKAVEEAVRDWKGKDGIPKPPSWENGDGWPALIMENGEATVCFKTST
ncbi:MAG: tyrosine-type recombinase/integrase [Thermoplasmata archaeon]